LNDFIITSFDGVGPASRGRGSPGNAAESNVRYVRF